MRIIQLILIAFGLICSVNSVFADELNYNLVRLSYKAEQQVENDIMRVTIVASGQAENSKDVSDKVNDDMAWALMKVRGKKFVRSQTLGYQTYPQYKNRVIVSWSASQQLLLESTSVVELTALVGVLQEKLKVQNIQFQVSTQVKKTVNDDLLVLGIGGFREKADLIVKSMGGKEYKVVSMDVNENGKSPMVNYKNRQMDLAMSSASSSTPVVESGESNLAIDVSGSIQILY